MGITVGKADVRTDFTSHVPGVRRGNHRGRAKHQRGLHQDDTSDARRSTGINPGLHDPIMPDMPRLSPA